MSLELDGLAPGAAPIAISNRDGAGSLVLLCEHASNHIPDSFDRLGLSESDLQRHIAWDIGAMGLAEQLSRRLDAPLVYARYSRLLLDLNRDPSAADSIVVRSENIAIPGNQGLSPEQRRWRQNWLYHPFHQGLQALLDERVEAGRFTAIVSIHSFTPDYMDRARPWQIGVIARNDRRLANRLLSQLRGHASLCVGDNQPYAPQDGVYHSMDRHGEVRGLPCAMIEIRNDEIANERDQEAWATRLSHEFELALEGLHCAGVEGMR